MTAVLSHRQREALEGVKANRKPDDGLGGRERMGTLKRMGLVELERGKSGDSWTLTEKGKVALKDSHGAATAPDAPADDSGQA